MTASTVGAAGTSAPESPEAARERTARRLLSSSSRNSYDPLLDIDWDAEVTFDDSAPAYLPFERVSLFGTPLWDELSEQQRVQLSKHELASVASIGLWTEIALIQMLARYAHRQEPQAAHTQYALTEIGDETRHVIMFAKALERMGCPTYRPPRIVRRLVGLYTSTARGPALFAPVLITEEITDRLQRSTMNDEAIHPLIRMVNRIHVIEEARHVRFAREELARQLPRLGPLKRVLSNTVSALVGSIVMSVLIDPAVYATVGLDPREAARAARANPHHQQTRRWMAEKIMAFLAEQGMVTWYARPIYRRAHLL